MDNQNGAGDGRSSADYRKNDLVFSQGEPADAVFFIQRGQVKISVVSEQGKEAIVAVLDAAVQRQVDSARLGEEIEIGPYLSRLKAP